MNMNKLIALLLVVSLFATALPVSFASTLTLPGSVERIEKEAFAGDNSLEDVVLPEGVKRIESRAFADSSLSWINLPSSLEYIAADAFENTPNSMFYAEWDTYGFQWLVDSHTFVFIEAEAVGTGNYAIHWLPVTGVKNYTVLVYEDEDCNQLYASLKASGSETNVNTDVGVRYWFVLEYEQDGQTYRSIPVTAEPLETLEAPSGLWLELTGDGHVIPHWEAVAGATGYRVYSSRTHSEWSPDMDWFRFDGAPGAGDFSRLKIDCGEAMYIWVCADNGNGPNRRAFAQTKRYDGLMPAPENFHLTLTEDGHILPGWDAVPGAFGYRLYASIVTDEWSLEHDNAYYGSDPSEYDFGTLWIDYGETLFLWVCADNGSGPNELAYAEVTRYGDAGLPAPEGFALELTGDGHVLPTWTPVPRANGYRMYASITTDEWSDELDNFYISGEPWEGNYDELWIDYGQTLYLWVQADNGIDSDTNGRAFAQVTRTLDIRTLDSDDYHLDNLRLSTLKPISEAEAQDEEALKFIREFNDELDGYNQAVEAHNANLDDLHNQLVALCDTLSDVAVTEGKNTVTYDLGGDRCVVDRSILDGAIKGIAELTPSGVEGTMTATTVEGASFYITCSDDGIALTREIPAPKHASNAPYANASETPNERRLREFRETIEQIQEQWNLTKVIISGIAASTVALMERGERIWDKAVNGLRNSKYRAAYRTDSIMARTKLMLCRSVTVAMSAIDIGAVVNQLLDLASRWEIVNNFEAHDHPIDLDLSQCRFDIAHQLALDINTLEGMYRMEAYTGILQIAADVATLYSALASGATALAALPALVSSVVTALISLVACESLANMERQIFDRAVKGDSQLHSTVYGIIYDADTKAPLRDVTVKTLLDSVKTDEKGYYMLPVLPEPTSVYYMMHDYITDGIVATVNPYQDFRNNVNLETSREKFGTIHGKVIDKRTRKPVSGVGVYYLNQLKGSTDKEGKYSVSVPIQKANGKLRIGAEKDLSYSPENFNIMLKKEGEDKEQDAELEWACGICGKMIYEDGSPVVGANVSFRRSAYSRDSTRTDEKGEYWIHVGPGTYQVDEYGGLYMNYNYTDIRTEGIVLEVGTGIRKLPTTMWVDCRDAYMAGFSVGCRYYGDGRWTSAKNFVFTWGGHTARVPDGTSSLTVVSKSRKVSIHASGDVLGVDDGEYHHIEETYDIDLVNDKNKVGVISKYYHIPK